MHDAICGAIVEVVLLIILLDASMIVKLGGLPLIRFNYKC